jgi:hypothetical protein
MDAKTNADVTTAIKDLASGEKPSKYTEYLQSAKWQERADDMKARIGKCQIGSPTKRDHGCGGPLHVHHNTYERIGREFDTDLLVVCERHHAMIHGLDEGNRSRSKVYYKRSDGSFREVFRTIVVHEHGYEPGNIVKELF